MSRTCGCPDTATVTVDEDRHVEWHRQVAPLARADAATLQSAYGRPSTPARTYVDEQFDAARAQQEGPQDPVAGGTR